MANQGSPAVLLEHLQDAYWEFTPIDPDVPENQQVIDTALVTHLTPDIHKRLHKLKGFDGMNKL